MSDRVIKKSIEISATKNKVRKVLTTDTDIRERVAPFAEGNYAKSEWKEGGSIERWLPDGVCAKGVITTFEPEHQWITTFYDGDASKGFSNKLGKTQESYTITSNDNGITLDISSGPYEDIDRDQRGDKMAEMRDKALVIIKGLSEK